MSTHERALVTGASSGIGEAFARTLATAGTDLVLVARRRDRLESLAGELGPAVEVEVISADLTDEADLIRVEDRLADRHRPVDLLVNNAGDALGGLFDQAESAEVQRLLDLNVTAPTRLMRAALPGMLRRGRGGVVNVSSLAGENLAFGNATYGSTKAYLTVLTENVAEEVRGTGVSVAAVIPGLTRTEAIERHGHDADAGPSALWLEPREVVEAALDGLARGRTLVVPGRQYRVYWALVSALPRGLRRRMMGAAARRAGRWERTP